MSVTLVGKHEKDSRANRDAYVSAMLEMMESDDKICHVDCDLMNCIGTKKLLKAYPDRTFNAGIAEANAVGLSAGLASTGMNVFVHSFGIFASRRVFDQAYLSVGYSEWPVHIIGSDPGVSAAFNGGTHMPFEDCGLYLNVPNFVIVDPCDYAQLYSLTKKLASSGSPSYMRMVRKGVVKVYEDGSDFELGKGYQIREGSDVTLIASGILVDEALKAGEELEKKGISARIIDLPTWKPLDEEIILKAAEETGAIVTCENHQVETGLGSVIANLLARKKPTPMEFIGVQNRFGQVGPADFLFDEYNLRAKDILGAVDKVLARKAK